MNETIWQRDENWVGSEIEDSFVMVNIDSGKYVALNVTASAVWQALTAPSTPSQIEERMLGQFDVGADDCRRAVSGLLEQMRGLNLASPQ
jgi:hypothetical protein